MENKNDCSKSVDKAQTFAFELLDPCVQVCLHRGKEWGECFLLVKLDRKVFEIKCDLGDCSTDSALKTLFCRLFSLADGDITFKHIKVQDLDAQLHECLKSKIGD